MTDVKWGGSEVRAYTTTIQTWSIVVHGKVAIAMNEVVADSWRKGSSIWKGGPNRKENPARTMSVHIPAKGWRTGLHLVAAYAPIFSATKRIGNNS